MNTTPGPHQLSKSSPSPGSHNFAARAKSKRNLLSTFQSDDDDLLHHAARSQHPAYPTRFAVPDDLVDWENDFPGYTPVSFVDKGVVANNIEVNADGWADGPVPNRQQIEKRGSHELQARQLQWRYDAEGRPLNPRGRTGMCNRGKLGKWGPNHAGDAVVTRHTTRPDPDGGPPSVVLEMVAIKRKDTGEWALPGGMQDPGEVGMATLVREFKEEAGAVSEEQKAAFDAMVDELFKDSNGRVIYRGYVDDPRNTDNAWMETIAMHFHCSERMGTMLTLKAGDDAADVTWLEVDPDSAAYCALYASHRQIADLVYNTHGAGNPLEAYTGSRRLSIVLAEFEDEEDIDVSSSGDEVATGSKGRPGRLGQFVDVVGEAARWGWAALTASEHAFVEPGLTPANLLDINSICSQEMRVASLAVQLLMQAHTEGLDDDMKTVALRIANKLCKGDMTVAANVFENLKEIQPYAPLLPRLQLLATLMYEWAPKWTFAEDGSPTAPQLPSRSAANFFRLDARIVGVWRVLSFIDKPPALSRQAEIVRLRRAQLSPARCAFRPFALVMAGAPGCGKSRCIKRVVPVIGSDLGGPALRGEYAQINPDTWLHSLCDNNNAYRNVANYNNHETFLLAVAQRRHIIFDGTGKSVINTCSRVIGRLKANGYRVIVVVVLASMRKCWERIEARRKATDRAVPWSILASTTRELQRTIPIYVEGPRNGLCDSTYVLINEADGLPGGDLDDDSMRFRINADTPASERARAAGRAAELLQLDPSTKDLRI